MDKYFHSLYASVLFLLWLTCVNASQAFAGTSSLDMFDADNQAVSWKLKADTLTSHNESEILEASGNVFLQRGNDILKADYARYFRATNWVYLHGHVEVSMGPDVIRGEEAEFDLRTRTGWLENGTIFMAEEQMQLQGEKVVKGFGDFYTFRNAKVTTCPGDVPAWSLFADEAVVEVEGYAQLFGTSFNVLDNTIGYSPYLLLPAKKKRQSGFLLPEYGISSQRGFYYNQPYFWAIDESRDMTFNLNYMEKRGVMPGVEYRSHTADSEFVWFRADMLNDSHIVTHDGNDKVFSGDGLIRTNRDRYWLRGMTDGKILESDWTYRANLDYVSDQNFLREFKSGLFGFSRTRDSLFNVFGRDLNEVDMDRVSEGIVFRNWQRAGVALGMRYDQNPGYGHGNAPMSRNPTVQAMPYADAFLYKGYVLPTMPLAIEGKMQMANFYRHVGSTGARFDLAPRLSIPLNAGPFSLQGSLGLRQTNYMTTRQNRDYQTGPRQKDGDRNMIDVDIQAFTEASRAWSFDRTLAARVENAGKTEWTAIRHLIQPRMSYVNVPDVDQYKNPFYDNDDRILSTDELSWSVTNILTGRRDWVAVSVDEQGKEQVSLQKAYQDFVRWDVRMGYDFVEAERSRYVHEFDRQPLKDVQSYLDFYPVNWLSLWMHSFVSPYDGTITRQDQGVTLALWHWGSLSSSFSYRDKDYESRRKLRDEHPRLYDQSLNVLDSSIRINLNSQWSLFYRHYEDLKNHDNVERRFELAYDGQCYRIVGRVSSDYMEDNFQLMVEFPGLM